MKILCSAQLDRNRNKPLKFYQN